MSKKDKTDAPEEPGADAPKPRGKAKAAETRRAAGAAFADGALSVTLADGEVAAVPTGATVVVNGFTVPAENVPAWFAAHAKTADLQAKKNAAVLSVGGPVPTVPAVHFTLADTDEGVVARFDQR